MVSFRSKKGKRKRRVAYPITPKRLSLARRVHERRPKHARAIDEALRAKTTADYEKWRQDPSRLDIRGIDTPRRKGLKVIVAKVKAPKPSTSKKPSIKILDYIPKGYAAKRRVTEYEAQQMNTSREELARLLIEDYKEEDRAIGFKRDYKIVRAGSDIFIYKDTKSERIKVVKERKPAASKPGVFASREEFFEKYRNDPLVWAFSKQFNKALPEMIAGDSKSYKHEVGMILDDSETVALAPAGVQPNPRFETPPWLRERTDLLTDSVKVTPSTRNALRKLIRDNPAVVFQNASYDPKLIHKALMVLDTKSGPITFSKIPEMSGAPEIPMTMKDSHGNMIHIAPKTTDDMSNLPNVMRVLRGELQQITRADPLRGWKRDESEEGGNVQYWLDKGPATISVVKPDESRPDAEVRYTSDGKRFAIPGSPDILLSKKPEEIVALVEQHLARQ